MTTTESRQEYRFKYVVKAYKQSVTGQVPDSGDLLDGGLSLDSEEHARERYEKAAKFAVDATTVDGVWRTVTLTAEAMLLRTTTRSEQS